MRDSHYIYVAVTVVIRPGRRPTRVFSKKTGSGGDIGEYDLRTGGGLDGGSAGRAAYLPA